MTDRRSGAARLGLISASLVLAGAVLVWMLRRTWAEHDVSDPGVTL